MSDRVIQARNLTKTYRLYHKPHYRFLDAFGLLWRNKNAYTDRKVLDFDHLTIRRGEKVAIIGRNGAGKSTFLKLVSNVIRPTSGEIIVTGNLQALLGIGAGFHPDFTGRENVYSHLAHVGITGKQADEKFAEVVDFAELEEYIDQPMKTYSTGMTARLMFSACTVIVPDILIIDEVLGVGDAYFFQKSFARMRELCEGQGTTLLLVTHDIYSASMLCQRCVWIDKGQIIADGISKDIVHAYEASIRDQEETRLRQRRIAALQENLNAQKQKEKILYGYIHRQDNKPPDPIIAVSHIRFMQEDQELAALSIQSPDLSSIRLILHEKEGNWGAVEECNGRLAREFKNFGSLFYKLPFMIVHSGVFEAARQERLEVECGIHNAHQQELELVLLDPETDQTFRGLIPYAEGWSNPRFRISEQDTPALVPQEETTIHRYGQRALEITNVEFLDEEGREAHQFVVGSDMRIRLTIHVNDKDFCESPTLIVAFQKDGVVRTHRFWTDQILIDARDQTEGTIEILAQPLLLGQGHYMVTVSAFREGYFQSSLPKHFFTTNDQVLDIHCRAYEIIVKESLSYPLCNDAIFQHPALWNYNGKTLVESGLVKEEFVPSDDSTSLLPPTHAEEAGSGTLSFVDGEDRCIVPNTSWDILKAEGHVLSNGALQIKTSKNQFLYALASPILSKQNIPFQIRSLAMEITLQEGAISVGILNVQNEQWFFSHPILDKENHLFHFDIDDSSLPDTFQIILSNYQTQENQYSMFTIGNIYLSKV